MDRRRLLILLVIYGLLLATGYLLSDWAMPMLAPQGPPPITGAVYAAILSTMLIYIILSAIPFVPGAEIGLGLILAFGADIAVWVYLGMVFALSLAFLIGRLVRVRSICRGFRYFGLMKAADLMETLIPLSPAQRVNKLTEAAPKRVVQLLLTHRHLALMLLLNLPGNSVIGGGGGIAMIAGISGLFSARGFFMAVLIAVAPVPLFFLLFG